MDLMKKKKEQQAFLEKLGNQFKTRLTELEKEIYHQVQVACYCCYLAIGWNKRSTIAAYPGKSRSGILLARRHAFQAEQFTN